MEAILGANVKRFFLEQKDGLRPAPLEQLTADDLARVVPPGMFDVGDGLYSPKTKCVTDPLTGEVLRIPTATEEQWIMEHARTAELKTAGFCPQFYENLFGKTVSTPGERAEPTVIGEKPDQELLRVVQQEGYELEPPPKDKILDQTHILRLKEPKRKTSSSSTKSSEETLFSDLIKNMDHKTSSSGTSWNGSLGQSVEDYERIGSKELSLYKFLHDVGFKVSGRMEQLLLQDGASESTVASTDSTMKRSHSFSGTKSNLEVLRALTRVINSTSSKNTMPFTISSSNFSPMTTPLKMSEPTSEVTLDHLATEESSNVFSEYMGSKEHFNIDYLEFASAHDIND